MINQQALITTDPNGLRLIRSQDLIDGVLQLLDGKLTMEMVDKEDGRKYRVRIELDPVEGE